MYSMSNGSKNGSDTVFPPVSFKSSSLGHSSDQYPEIEAVRQPQTINIHDQHLLLGDCESAESVLLLSEPMVSLSQLGTSVSRIKSVLNYFQNLYPSRHYLMANYFISTNYSIDQVKLDYLCRINGNNRNHIRKYLNQNRCKQAVSLRSHFEFYFWLKSANLHYAWCMCLFQQLFNF